MSVSAFSSDATATNGLNYGAATNVLSWIAGDVSNKTFSVPLIHDGLVTSNLIAKLRLTDSLWPALITISLWGLTTNATLTIINDDFFGSPTFSTPTYTVNNNGGFVTITVNRLGGSAQTITVNYTTVDGTGANAAFAGVDYTAISGTSPSRPVSLARHSTCRSLPNPARSATSLLASCSPAPPPLRGRAVVSPSAIPAPPV